VSWLDVAELWRRRNWCRQPVGNREGEWERGGLVCGRGSGGTAGSQWLAVGNGGVRAAQKLLSP
jgi:hypothetical protein